MTRPILTFLGATGTVTGSRFLIESSGSRALIEAGLYQGVSELRKQNWRPFPTDPGSLTAVVLTHAHLDHCGYLPKLVRDGFRGRIVCTLETAELAMIVLRDSAHLQEEDAAYANEVGFSKHHPALPLYDSSDVDATEPLFSPVTYDTLVTLSDTMSATLHPAGHILGSASALVDAEGCRVLFSGDLGRPMHPLLQPPADPPRADVIVVESTYGDREHVDPGDSALADAIVRTAERGGTVLIPAFAVDRTELVLLEIARLRAAGRIPPLPIFVDSPMALRALDVYRDAVMEPEARMRSGVDLDAFRGADVHPVSDAAGSERLNHPSFPCIIISASGMATGGRVVHHLRHQLPDSRNTVVLTGYQAEGTRGRQLLDGARQLKLHGRYVPVHAEIVQVQDFSVHADAAEIVGWLGRSPKEPRVVYVVHGEPHASHALATKITDELGWCAVAPSLGERVRLD